MDKLEQYSLKWNHLSNSDRGAVPLGNGEVGVSLWVTRDGVQFYIARTDAMAETDRNVKLGKVTLKMEPNPFSPELPFEQRLNLQDGSVTIEAGEKERAVSLKIFVAKDCDVIYVCGTSKKAVDVRVHYHNWRLAQPDMKQEELQELPDIVEQWGENLLFYHQNGESTLRETAEGEALGQYIDMIPDTLGNRIFGGMLGGEGFKVYGVDAERKGTTSFVFKAATMSRQDLALEDWKAGMAHAFEQAPDAKAAFEHTREWWNNYWSQSFIWVDGDDSKPPHYAEGLLEYVGEEQEELPGNSPITRAHVHSKYMFACCGSGNFPIIFNGALFNLMPGDGIHIDLRTFGRAVTAPPLGEPTVELNPDERPWGHCTLWQNQRHPYHAMLGRGEYENVRRLFRHYRKFWDIDRAKAKVYYGGEGQYNNEIITTYGLMPLGCYGTDRRGKPDGYAVSRWSGAVDYSPGLELVLMMFDYYNYTSDEEFLLQDVLPYAKDLLRGIETRFRQRENGKMVLYPLHSVETFHDCKNPITVVGGIYAVLERVEALDNVLSEYAEYFREYKKIVPDMPTEVHPMGYRFAPADEYAEQRNVEPVWMNPIFPYRLVTKYHGDYQKGYNTYHFCERQKEGAFQPYALGSYPMENSYSGWQYVGMVAALLGLSSDCAEILSNNCAQNNPGHKYPAMWGPCYDSVPDVDHAANLQTTLQLMLLQVEGDKIYVLPAWKPEWNVHFKLPAPKNTTVECRFENGAIQELIVMPPERRADVEICFKPLRLY